MSDITITITDAGRTALIAASGTNKVTIAQIGVTAAEFAASATSNVLPGEIKRLATFSGEAPDAYTIHLTIRDDSVDAYELRGFALYLSDGTLFGIYSNGAALIMEKASASMLLLAVDIQFTEADAAVITFGDTNFTNPPATTERVGVVELATEDEAKGGIDATRVVTSKTMFAAVSDWLNTRFGPGAPSEFIKGLLTSVSASTFLKALGIKSVALKDEGHGGGIDSDKLDGKEAGDFAAANHTHVIANVTGLQSVLDAKLPAASYTASDVKAKLMTVDGSGSGVDADTLDGKQASDFAAASHTHVIANVSGLQSALDAKLPTASYTASDVKAKLMTVDGSGSGIDADTLDGKQASDFAAANHAHVIANVSGLQSALDAKLTAASYTASDVRTKLMTVDGSGSGLDTDLLDGQHGSYYLSWSNLTGVPNTFPPASHNHSILAATGVTDANADRGTFISLIYNTTGSINFPSQFGIGIEARRASNSLSDIGTFQLWVGNNSDNDLYFRSVIDYGTGDIWAVWNKLWHSGNDGSGSGVDADTVDGYHASDFLNGKCAAYILFTVNSGIPTVVASSGVTIATRQQSGIYYFTVNRNCPIGFALGMAAPVSFSDGINVIPPDQRMTGNGATYHFEFKYTSSKSLTDPQMAMIQWF